MDIFVFAVRMGAGIRDVMIFALVYLDLLYQ